MDVVQNGPAGYKKCMKVTRSVIALVAGLFCANAEAQVRTEQECARLHPGITSSVEYASCMYDSTQAEKALKTAFAKLWPHVHGESRNLLLKAEQAWLKNRDAQCAYEADGYPNNTAFSSSMMACVADANRARAKYLEDDIKRW